VARWVSRGMRSASTALSVRRASRRHYLVRGMTGRHPDTEAHERMACAGDLTSLTLSHTGGRRPRSVW
jgi:hypothetical protein